MGGLGKTLLANEISEKLFSRNTTILKFDLKYVYFIVISYYFYFCSR
jgi:hypothetical protein